MGSADWGRTDTKYVERGVELDLDEVDGVGCGFGGRNENSEVVEVDAVGGAIDLKLYERCFVL